MFMCCAVMYFGFTSEAAPLLQEEGEEGKGEGEGKGRGFLHKGPRRFAREACIFYVAEPQPSSSKCQFRVMLNYNRRVWAVREIAKKRKENRIILFHSLSQRVSKGLVAQRSEILCKTFFLSIVKTFKKKEERRKKNEERRTKNEERKKKDYSPY